MSTINSQKMVAYSELLQYSREARGDDDLFSAGAFVHFNLSFIQFPITPEAALEWGDGVFELLGPEILLAEVGYSVEYLGEWWTVVQRDSGLGLLIMVRSDRIAMGR